MRICNALEVLPGFLSVESQAGVAHDGELLKTRDALHEIIAQAEHALGLAE